MKKPTLHTYRRSAQIFIALAFIVIPFLNHIQISFAYGNFLSFHFFFIPFVDPLAVLQIFLKNNYLSLDLIIGAGFALLLALTLGTVFCSWICPFGLLSEWGHTLSKRRFKKKHLGRKPNRVSGFLIKLCLFGLGLGVFLLFSTTPILNQLSLPAWYSRIFQFWFEQWHISLAILALAAIIVIEVVAGKRLWCRYVCPQSVLITLFKQLNPRRMRIGYNEESCICKKHRKAPCQKACSLGLDPRTVNRWHETDCSNCGDCITACKKCGKALAYKSPFAS